MPEFHEVFSNANLHRIYLDAQKSPYQHRRGTELFLEFKTWDDKWYCLNSRLEVVEVGPGSTLAEPFLRVPDHVAQSLLDSLWNSGYRPSDAPSGDALIAAKDAHVADLQRVSFSLLETLISQVAKKPPGGKE